MCEYAYLGAWNAIPPAKPNPLLSYIVKIVRNISLKIYRRKEAVKRSSHYTIALQEIEACIADQKTVEDEIEARELASIIESFLDMLILENRVIFMRRYLVFRQLQGYSRVCGAFGEKHLRPADPYPRENEAILDRKRGVRMKVKKFSDAMSELDSKYIDEALNYKKKAKKPVWVKWRVMLACLCIVIAVFRIPHIFNSMQNDEEVTAGGDTTTDNTTVKITFKAMMLEVQDNVLVVEPLAGTPEHELAESISINTEDLSEFDTVEYVARAQVGDIVKVGYLKEYSNIGKGGIAVYEIVPVEK